VTAPEEWLEVLKGFPITIPRPGGPLKHFYQVGHGPCASGRAAYSRPDGGNILAKLGVHSQLQALVLALRYELVEVR
jgi:hypothetical protein